MERAIEATVRDREQLASIEDGIDAQIGARIRARREQRGESLRAFATRCGVSASMLSDVERGEKSPTISILSAIAEGLGVPLSRLVSNEDTLESGPRILRAEDLVDVIDPTNGVHRCHLGPLTAESKVEFVRFVFPEGTATGGFSAHAMGTIERVYVVSGCLEISVEGKSVTLDRGDTAIYRAAVAHSMRAVGTHPCEALLVIERP